MQLHWVERDRRQLSRDSRPCIMFLRFLLFTVYSAGSRSWSNFREQSEGLNKRSRHNFSSVVAIVIWFFHYKVELIQRRENITGYLKIGYEQWASNDSRLKQVLQNFTVSFRMAFLSSQVNKNLWCMLLLFGSWVGQTFWIVHWSLITSMFM